MGGFEVLVAVSRHNAKATEEAFNQGADLLGSGTREGIPVAMWRQLPDAPPEA
jgi:hypothetical protein